MKQTSNYLYEKQQFQEQLDLLINYLAHTKKINEIFKINNEITRLIIKFKIVERQILNNKNLTVKINYQTFQSKINEQYCTLQVYQKPTPKHNTKHTVF